MYVILKRLSTLRSCWAFKCNHFSKPKQPYKGFWSQIYHTPYIHQHQTTRRGLFKRHQCTKSKYTEKLQTIQSCIYLGDLFYSADSTLAHGKPMVWLTELIFIAACMELCFDLLFKREWIRPMFWLLLDSAYTVLGLFFHPLTLAPVQQIG